ncbi:tyrosine--tRNA ligase [Candidatus Bathyarchaeota archaeon]|nr:MAG: tyrosine--tRNA ligase [Candidatus Bathyarchaeota archaeon]
MPERLPGLMHIGTGLVCGTKIKDMVKAGFHFIIFLADWHSMINNKFGGDMEKIETAGEYFKHCFTALGLAEDKVEYIWASELAGKPNYWERVIRIAKTITAQRAMRALPIMGRDMKAQDVEAASLFYPCMQAADIFEMNLDVACAGIDQRKAHVLAREAGEKLRWGKPVALHTPMLMGLAGIQGSDQGSYDDDPKLSSVIAAKMSKSKPENTILLHDSPELIEEKLRKAYCPPKIIEGNPVIEYYRVLAFRENETVILRREQKYGGDLKFSSFKELEEAYKTEKIHPQDLKANMARILADVLREVRDYFNKHPEPLEQMRKIEAR